MDSVCPRTIDGADGEEHQNEVAPEEHHQQDHEKDERERVEHVDEAHHQLVGAATEEAGNGPVGDADDQRNQGCEQPDRQRDAAGDECARQQVAAIGIGPEQEAAQAHRHVDDQAAALVAALDDARGPEHVGALEQCQHPLVDRPLGDEAQCYRIA